MDDIRERAINKLRVPNQADYVVSITPLGKKEVERMRVPENQWRVLNYLNESGPTTVRDIAREMGVTEKTAGDVCKTMYRSAMIRKQGGGEE